MLLGLIVACVNHLALGEVAACNAGTTAETMGASIKW